MADETKYGLTAQGFKRKRLPEIQANIFARLSDRLGTQIQTGSNSLFGQLVGIYSYEISDIWEELENVYNAMYPRTASGISLTNAASLANIMPISASKTTILCACTGDDGTGIPAGSQVQDSNNNTYSNSSIGQITKSKASTIVLSLKNVTTAEAYSLTIDGNVASYTAKENDSVGTVLTALVGELNISYATFSISNGSLTVSMDDNTKNMSLSAYNLTIGDVTSNITFTADATGAISPAIGDVQTINTAVSGWKSVKNIQNSVGRDAETDTEMRQRWSISVYEKASAMVDAIQAAIVKNVSGVTDCKVYENYTDVTDENGMLPHSIEAVVDGGDELSIAQEIFTHRAGGIDTNGNIAQEVQDIQGVPHTIKFNRPAPILVWLKIVISKNTEELWGNNSPNEIKTLILNQASNLKIGEDVILQKLITAVYNNMSGIGYVDLKAATGETAGTYTTSNISIAVREKALFDISRIEVSMNDE